MADFDSKLCVAMHRLGFNKVLKTEQVTALRAFHDKKDVLCLLPTGFGKSLIFQLTPFLSDDNVTIVIGPLNSILKDQVYLKSYSIVYYVLQFICFLIINLFQHVQ